MERDSLLVARAWKAAGYDKTLECVLRDALQEEGDTILVHTDALFEAWLDARELPCLWNVVWEGVRYTCDDVYNGGPYAMSRCANCWRHLEARGEWFDVKMKLLKHMSRMSKS